MKRQQVKIQTVKKNLCEHCGHELEEVDRDGNIGLYCPNGYDLDHEDLEHLTEHEDPDLARINMQNARIDEKLSSNKSKKKSTQR